VRTVARYVATHPPSMMTMAAVTKTPHDDEGNDLRRRGRGRPPQISREQIVAAARSVPREDVTMKAVADALGVTRKALHYHVGDRDGLINLMVVDLFESELAGIDLPNDADWRIVLRAYARAFRDGVVQVGVPATHVQMRGMGGLAAMELAEHVIQSLLRAGFDAPLARRALTAISNVAFAAANIDLLKTQHGIYPHEAEISAALAQALEHQFPGLRGVLASARDDGPDDEFEFELNLVLTGLEQALAASST
jgi:TetR/AcrR family tetracycline transcriptional repressor